MLAGTSTIHASAVLVGRKAALIRGPAGAGKSRLALALIEAAATGALPFARLVADDRVFLEACSGRLLARFVTELAGLLEVRGLGIRRLPYDAIAAIGLVVDLAANEAARLPGPGGQHTTLAGVQLPLIGVPKGVDPLPLILAYRHTVNSGI